MTYDDMRENKKKKLLALYTELLEKDEINKAYNVMIKLMKYRFIPFNSQSISAKALKDLESLAGVERRDNLYDYRNKDAELVLPENILFNNPLVREISVVSKEHWGIRRELSYQGDYILPEKTLKYFIRLKSTELTARAAIKGMEELYERLSKLKITHDWYESVMSGKNKMYAIEIDHSSSFKIRTLGYINVGFTNTGKPLLRVILDNTEMEKQYIDIKDSYRIVHEAMASWYSKRNKIDYNDVVYEPLCDVELIGARQRSNQKPVLTMEEHVMIKNEALAKMSKEELEKELEWK